MLCTSRASCMGPFAHRPLRSLQETKPISARSAGWGRQALLPPQTPCSPHPLWPTSARWHRLGTHRWRTSTPNCCEVKADAGQDRALGATIHQVVAGSAPFQGIEEVPVVQALSRLLMAPAPVLGDLPAPVADLVTSCLSVDPANRPTTARDVADRLDAAAMTW